MQYTRDFIEWQILTDDTWLSEACLPSTIGRTPTSRVGLSYPALCRWLNILINCRPARS